VLDRRWQELSPLLSPSVRGGWQGGGEGAGEGRGGGVTQHTNANATQMQWHPFLLSLFGGLFSPCFVAVSQLSRLVRKRVQPPHARGTSSQPTVHAGIPSQSPVLQANFVGSWHCLCEKEKEGKIKTVKTARTISAGKIKTLRTISAG
jgi:hypothetical protein